MWKWFYFKHSSGETFQPYWRNVVWYFWIIHFGGFCPAEYFMHFPMSEKKCGSQGIFWGQKFCFLTSVLESNFCLCLPAANKGIMCTAENVSSSSYFSPILKLVISLCRDVPAGFMECDRKGLHKQEGSPGREETIQSVPWEHLCHLYCFSAEGRRGWSSLMAVLSQCLVLSVSSFHKSNEFSKHLWLPLAPAVAGAALPVGLQALAGVSMATDAGLALLNLMAKLPQALGLPPRSQLQQECGECLFKSFEPLNVEV